MPKRFKIEASQIRPLAVGYGSCIASDHITVEGKPVGFAYREAPSDDIDSGWRFMSGDENDDFLENSNNFEIYDVNTIANYDPLIIQLLKSTIGSEFFRSADKFIVAPS